MRLPSRGTVRVVAAAAAVLFAALLANGYLAAGAAGSADPGTNLATPTPGTSTGTPPGATADGGESGGQTPDATDGATPAGTAAGANGSTAAPGLRLESSVNRSNVSTEPIPPGAEVTVVATQGFFVSDENAELAAFTRSGELVYHDDAYKVYFDVDPVPGTEYTVEYLASSHVYGADDCGSHGGEWCTNNVLERANLSTGEVERVWANKTPGIYGSRYHDADRINDTHRVIADIEEDTVFVVNVSSGEVGWTWHAGSIYSRDQGGKEGDWTHINDVELLDDGRVMVSVRNMDEVLFLEPANGSVTVQRDWTLGTDEDHDVLYEQHNPDYIPRERGGPAVIVADSENNRVVEYARADGQWTRTWTWRDVRLQWPRDADRLPNGNTLVVDSHGDRVVEVTPDGEVVWSVEIGMPYDAERLGTGAESAGGHAMARPPGADDDADEDDGTDAGNATGETVGGDARGTSPATRVLLAVKDLLPSLVVNGLLYVSPSWVHFADLLVGFGLLATLLGWGGLELYWSSLSIRGVAGGLAGRLAGILG